jgi:hypothetical protein
MTVNDFRILGIASCLLGWAFLIFGAPVIALGLLLLAFGCFVYVLYKDQRWRKSE